MNSPKFKSEKKVLPEIIPIGCMYGMFTYIYHKRKPNVGKYNHTWILWEEESSKHVAVTPAVMMLLMWKASSSPMAVSWLDNKPLHLGWRFWNMTLSPWFLLIRMAPITKKWGKQTTCYLLMIQKSRVHQLRLVGYPIIYRGFRYTSQLNGQISVPNSETSTRWI